MTSHTGGVDDRREPETTPDAPEPDTAAAETEMADELRSIRGVGEDRRGE